LSLEEKVVENASEAREKFTEEQVLVRQVTHVQASWAERERGEAGAFTIQLILDQGVDEYILRPSAKDAEVLLNLFKISAGATFDRARKVLMFKDLAIS
jgi:hypothetical protein